MSSTTAGEVRLNVERFPALSKLNFNGCVSRIWANSSEPKFVLPSRDTRGAPLVYYLKAPQICFEFAKMRGESKDCEMFGPDGACHHVTSSLVHSPTLRKVVDVGVQAIMKRDVAISAPLHWHAVHFNTYWCTHKLHKGVSLERFHSDVLSVIHDRLVGGSAHREGIYFITELRGDEFKRASKGMFPNAVWKEDVFPNATADFPFEVAAQVDFEIGFALASKSGGEYFGQFTDTATNSSVSLFQ